MEAGLEIWYSYAMPLGAKRSAAPRSRVLSESLWIVRDLQVVGPHLFAAAGGGVVDRQCGGVWRSDGDVWEQLFPLKNDERAVGWRPRLVCHDNALWFAVARPDDELAELWRVKDDAPELVLRTGEGVLSDYRLTEIACLLSVGGDLYLGGLGQADGEKLVTVLRLGLDGVTNLTDGVIPGAAMFRAATVHPYCIQAFDGGILAGSFNQTHAANRTGQIWRYEAGDGWSLDAGGVESGAWVSNQTDAVLAMCEFRGELISSLMRLRGTPPNFSSIWARGASGWRPIFGDLNGTGISHATHFNALTVAGGNLYCGVGCVYEDWDRPDPDAAPSVWRMISDNHWEKVAGDGVAGSWSAADFATPEGLACSYIYCMTEFQGRLVVGTTSRTGGGPTQIWSVPL